jgi:molybdopterin synthase sulfur carrier subunit
MNITVKYFASLSELVGRREETVEIFDGATVSDIWQQVSMDIEETPDNLLSAVNMAYVKADAKLSDGDEVAFFPPVTGG